MRSTSGLLLCVSFCLSLLLGIFWAAPLARAVTLPTNGESLSADIFPEHPRPNTAVTIILDSITIDLPRATVVWSVNGSTVISETGKVRFTTTLGAVGSQTTVRATVTPAGGTAIQKTFVFTPAEVDILWEAGTYTPPQYPGKALPSSETLIEAVAYPNFVRNGVRVSPDDLLYRWRNSDTPDAVVSGIGKNSVTLVSAKKFGENVIEVEVSTRDGALVAEGSTEIEIVDPKILFYEDRPLAGPWYAAALEAFTSVRGREITLRAEPYFFDRTAYDTGTLEIVWRANGEPIAPPATPWELTIRSEEGGVGDFGVRVRHPSLLLQTAAAFIRLSI